MSCCLLPPKTARRILFVTLLLIVVGGFFSFRNIPTWLDRSAEPIYSDIIVCLSYNPARLDRAISLLHKGYGKKIVATTKITYTNLKKRQVPEEQIVMLASSGTNTYEEGLLLQKYLQNNPYDRILFISDPYHLYRVQWTMEHLFKNAAERFSYVAAVPRDRDVFWWDTPLSRREVLREIPSIIYYWLGHGVLGLKHNPVWVDAVKYHYLDLLEGWF